MRENVVDASSAASRAEIVAVFNEDFVQQRKRAGAGKRRPVVFGRPVGCGRAAESRSEAMDAWSLEGLARRFSLR